MRDLHRALEVPDGESERFSVTLWVDLTHNMMAS